MGVKDWLTIVVIPLAIALGSWLVSNAIQQSQKRVKYIEIAVGILDKEPSPKKKAIRDWAIEVLAEYSPIEVNNDMKEALRNNPIFSPITGTLNKTLDDAKLKAEGTVRDSK